MGSSRSLSFVVFFITWGDFYATYCCYSDQANQHWFEHLVFRRLWRNPHCVWWNHQPLSDIPLHATNEGLYPELHLWLWLHSWHQVNSKACQEGEVWQDSHSSRLWTSRRSSNGSMGFAAFYPGRRSSGTWACSTRRISRSSGSSVLTGNYGASRRLSLLLLL